MNLELAAFPFDASKLPLSMPPITEEFFPPLAMIAIMWGKFENEFRAFLEAMISANKSADRRVLYHSFESKIIRFEEEMRCFDCYPWIAIYLKKIIADALALQRTRNLLLHGTMNFNVSFTNNEATTPIQVKTFLIVEGRRKGQPVIEEFSVGRLYELSTDLQHLCGRMEEFTHPKPDIPNLAWQDRLWLRAFLRTNHSHYAQSQPT